MWRTVPEVGDAGSHTIMIHVSKISVYCCGKRQSNSLLLCSLSESSSSSFVEQSLLYSSLHVSIDTAVVDQPLRLLTLFRRITQTAPRKPSPAKAWNGSGDIRGQGRALGAKEGGFRGIWRSRVFHHHLLLKLGGLWCFYQNQRFFITVSSFMERGCLVSKGKLGQKGKKL